MNEINLKKVQAALDELPEQIFLLQNMLMELEKTEFILKKMSYTEISISYIKRAIQEITEEIGSLTQMQICIEEVVHIYRKMEQNIADTYDLECIVYPRTSFGRNRIGGMASYEHLFFWNM